jgi:hypothetical protein
VEGASYRRGRESLRGLKRGLEHGVGDKLHEKTGKWGYTLSKLISKDKKDHLAP